MVALDRRLDETGGIVRSTVETVLRETESDFARLNRGELRRDAAFGRGLREVPVNSGTDQLAQFVLVHSTHSS
jgi:hypothetical protein